MSFGISLMLLMLLDKKRLRLRTEIKLTQQTVRALPDIYIFSHSRRSIFRQRRSFRHSRLRVA